MRPKSSKETNCCNCHTTRTGTQKEEGKSVRKRDFCDMYEFGWFGRLIFFFLNKITGFWKTGRSLPALLPQNPHPTAYLLGVLPIELSFPKKDKHPEGTSDPTPEGGCIQSGKWPLGPVWFSKLQYPSFQITLSEHSFKIVTFLSFLPAMGFHISEINYKLRSSDFHSRILQAGGSPQCLSISPDPQQQS